MAKRLKVTVTVEDDILVRLRRSYYDVGKCGADAIEEIKMLRMRLGKKKASTRIQQVETK